MDVRHIRAFTITELVVVVAIVAVLASVSVAAFSMITARAKSARCMNQLRQIGGALNLYLGDHQMILPELVAAREDRDEEAPAIDNTLDVYLGEDARVFRCPADSTGLAEKTGTSYFWNSLLNGQRATALDFLGLKAGDAGIPVVSDKENFHRYIGHEVNVLYADGHVDKELRFQVGEGE